MKQWDVAIIGAGPAGAACAALIARAGYEVLLLEKETFPRFRIGESLLPVALPVFQELGLELDPGFALRKGGARVIDESGHHSYRISFEMTLPGCPDHAYQVVRADFDRALVKKADEAGAECRFEWGVTRIDETDENVVLHGPRGQIHTRFLVDATGQSALTSAGSKRWVRGMGRFATYRHFQNVCSSKARETFVHGDILLILTADGSWAWAIPLPDDRLSVGIVGKDGMRPQRPEEAMAAFLSDSPLMQQILKGSSPASKIHRCSDYSYYSRRPSTARTVALGDAHAFLDPVFSSGVSIALVTAAMLKDPLLAALKKDSALDLAQYHHKIDQGYRVFERLIERFYRPGWREATFFGGDKPETWVRQLNTMLAGDVWRDDNPWQNKLLAARRRTISFQDRLSETVSV